jgi:DNA polymerase-3 subunit epsilon
LVARVSDADRAAHLAFVATLGDKAIWLDYAAVDVAAPKEA